MGVPSALYYEAPLEKRVIREQILSHIKEENLNNEHCPHIMGYTGQG